MSINIVFNGFIVQDNDLKEGYESTSYCGLVSHESWPLSSDDSGDMEEVLNKWFYNWYSDRIPFLWVCPDYEFVQQYIAKCSDVGIKTRLLSCRSFKKEPFVEAFPVINEESLGWDYVSSSFDFSTIDDDFFGNVPQALVEYLTDLNEFGLFSELEIIERYVQARSFLLAQGINLEQNSGMSVVHISQVK